MLWDRLRTAALLIGVTTVLGFLDWNYAYDGLGGIWLLPLLLFFTAGTAWDFVSLLVGSGRLVSRRITVIAAILVSLSGSVPLLWPLFGQPYPVNCPIGRLGWNVLGAIAGITLITFYEMQLYRKGRTGTVERLAFGVLVTVYVGCPMALMASIRQLGDDRWGFAALITMISVTKSCDIGAYTFGRLMGQNKMTPTLSPGKTWEGAVGGILLSILVAWALLHWLMPAVGKAPMETASLSVLTNPLVGAFLLGPSLAIAAMVGDLAESMVKRDTGAKDSGNTLPGMGGVWDVSDSLILAVGPAYLAFAAGIGW